MQKREVFTPALAVDTLCLQERIIMLLQHDNDFEIGSTFNRAFLGADYQDTSFQSEWRKK
jgi:hypothetical protein